MSTLFYVLLILAPAAILATAYAIIKKRNQGRSIKRSVAVNLATFAVLTVLIAALSVSVFAADDNTASAADASAATTATETVDNSKGMGLLAAGLVTGLAGIGGWPDNCRSWPRRCTRRRYCRCRRRTRSNSRYRRGPQVIR